MTSHPKTYPAGPQPTTHTERWARAEDIATRLRDHYGRQLLALGVYGSLGRGQDGPYSDIEMHCILRGEGIDTCFEWSTGPWKAEVDVYSPDEILYEAAFVDGDWPITHSAYAVVKPLYDPDHFFKKLRAVTLTHPDHVFRERIEEVIVGEVYELVGKIRNAAHAGSQVLLAVYTAKLAVWGACLVGLQHRHLFTSMGQIFAEAGDLPNPPDSLHALFEIATSGKLGQPDRIHQVTDRFWAGVEDWAGHHGYTIETSLDTLLENSSK
jgi:kanamycin nucleotidyltransferase